MKNFDVIVVGGGAAGLMAAGQSAKTKKKTLLLEKMESTGRKILLSGKGRCNITNSASINEFVKAIHPNANFIKKPFGRFFNEDTIKFFEDLGEKSKLERGGRYFPVSEKASVIAELLHKWVLDQGAEIRTRSGVKSIVSNNGIVSGVEIITGEIINADKIIVATGGKSYPATGSTGDGYLFAKEFGHKIITTFPALVPLETVEEDVVNIQGSSLKNINVDLFINGKKKKSEFGEMLFTHYGLSGPVILKISRDAVVALNCGSRVDVSIDFKPALNTKTLDKRLLRDFEQNSKKQFDKVLKELLPAKLILYCIEKTGIKGSKLASQINSKERKVLLNFLKGLNFTIKKSRQYKEAVITAGGVNTKEINPNTMESRKVKGLYFCGEVLNVDGDTGGYNLQIAFSTGWVAGTGNIG